MYEALKNSVFLLIPLVAWLLLSCILSYQYYKDRNKRKLVFTIGIFVSAFSFYNPFIESIGATPFFSSSNWLFLPITLAVVIAALSSLLKVEDFKVPFTLFLCATVASAVAFFLQFPSIVQITLTILFMATSIPILTYIFMKSHASADLYFLIAALCFFFEGLVAGLGTSIDIPVLLAIFGVVFIGLMFYRPENVNPSTLPSFIILEKKLDEANHNLKVMEAKLLKAERLAAIGELAGIIGHDLRNPLQGIMGATHYLKSHAKKQADPVCLEMLNEIDECILRADKIVNDLVEYSQVITLMPFSTTPSALTSKALSQLKPPANIEIVNQTASEPQLTVDDLKIQRAFVAIIKNAFDAMPSGGKLTLKSRKSHGGQVVFSFQDTGAGMTEETLAKLWTPLFTTKAQGMGFGLAVSKRFVEAHGGQITARSVLGKGTTITVMLPQDFRAAG